MSIKSLCKKHNLTEQTFFRWRNKFGGLEVKLSLAPLSTAAARLLPCAVHPPVHDGGERTRPHSPASGS